MDRSVILFVFVLAAASHRDARVDTVKLTNGREVQGTVEEETKDDQVVVKTVAGRMTFPRAMVASTEVSALIEIGGR